MPSNVARLPARGHATERAPSAKTTLPADFALTDELRAWAKARGITRLEERFEQFCDYSAAKGYQYASWPAAFREACRKDWAQLGQPRAPITCVRCGWLCDGGNVRTDRGYVCMRCHGK